MVQVTAAIIRKDDKILICQRPPDKRCALLWEFPGGKIERGETPEACLMRECCEELGVKLEVEHFICALPYQYPDITVNIRFYVCQIIEGKPTCIEHADIRWLPLTEIIKLPLCPADKNMLEVAAEDIQKAMQFDKAL